MTHRHLPDRCIPLVGAHINISKGLLHALAIGQELGCTAIQLFTHSNRQWSFKLPQTHVIDAFLKARQESSICQILVHGSYLMNPASPDPDLAGKTLANLVQEIICCQLLGIDTLIIHPGSRLEHSLDSALSQCAQTINRARAQTRDSTVKILIETMAGQGSTIGSSFQELAAIIDQVEDKAYIGVCVDTCHIAASGYSFYTPEQYAALWKDFDQTIGLSNLHALHLNDSAKPIASKIDRHTHIGQGFIGLEAFRLIMQDPRLAMIPKILETPKDEELKDDKKNLALLHSLISEQKGSMRQPNHL